jgi:hypothetical protein
MDSKREAFVKGVDKIIKEELARIDERDALNGLVEKRLEASVIDPDAIFHSAIQPDIAKKIQENINNQNK